MVVEASAALLTSFLLALLRTSAWLVLVPPFNGRTIPVQVKVAVALALAIPVAPQLVDQVPPPEVSALIGATLLQVLMGLALGFVTLLVFSAVQAAGELIDMQVGFSLGAMVDPLSGVNQAVFGRLYQLLALTLLFVIDGHLLLVRGLLASFEITPSWPGDWALLAERLVHDLGAFFVAAVQIALPLIAALFLAEVVLGLLSRAAPRMEVFILGFPLKIALALVLVGLTIPLLPGAVDAVTNDAAREHGRLIGVFDGGQPTDGSAP